LVLFVEKKTNGRGAALNLHGETIVTLMLRWNQMLATGAVIACLILIFSIPSAAEPVLVRLAVGDGKDIRFAHLNGKDGLFPGQIRGILQDDQGFLWFNTTGVLDRYDGYEFKSFTRDATHPNYPAGGFIHTIFKDRSGFLWVSSNESLDRFDPKTETTTHFAIDRNGPHSVLGPVTHVSEDRAGVMWLSTASGLHRLDPATGAFQHYAHDPADPDSLGSSVVRSTYEDRAGTLWVCTEVGLDAFDRRTEKVTERIRLNLAESRTIKAFEDHVGVLWIIYSYGNGLASYDRVTKRLTLYSFESQKAKAAQLSGTEGIHEDADGNLWLATRLSGLVRIDRNRRSAVRYRHSSLDPDSISEDFSKAVFEDREGSIWVGMGATGLNHFERKPLPFKRYRHEPDNPQSLLGTFVMAVYADRQENIWVGSPLGVTRIDGKSGKYSFFTKPAADPANLSNTTSIVEDRSGYLWFGTYGGGLKRYDPRTGKFTAFRHNPADPNSLSDDIVYTLMVDHQGVLWAGTDNGLSRCEDPASGRFRSWKGDPTNASPTDVRAIVEDPKGVLWLVSSVLERFDPATGHFTAYTFDAAATGTAGRKDSPVLVKVGRRIAEDSFLTIDHSGVLWVATANGLVRFDREHEHFTTYDERDGLPARAINGILEDRNGNLWVSTAGGLSQFNPRTKTFTNYYEADGLAGNAFEGFPAAYRSRSGQMFFGSKSGLTSFWPEQIVEKPYIPPVVLTGFSLRNLLVAPAPGSTLAKSISFTRWLTLSHAQNMLSFEFAALSYVDPQRNQYRYMLEPFDRSWNRVDAQHRLAIFTTLPAGDYTLRIQGSNNRGVWNEQGVALHLRILPPWWGTKWFRSVCAVVFVLLLGVAWRFRVQQLRHEFDMRLEERVAERTRIARDLHDTLLQSFQALLPRLQAGINMLVARPDDARKVLEDAADHASEAIAEGRDAVQGLRLSTVEKNDLALAIRTLGEELASAATNTSSPTFTVVVEGASRNLHPILRDEVYRLATEALRNAFRHAAARNIEVEIRYDQKYFRLRVRDNGKGIPSDVLKRDILEGHYGLPGIRERAKLVGGKLTIWTEVDGGTEIELNIPGAKAYVKSARPFWHFGKTSASDADEKETIERE
jgi:signal transduction histidine kinase/streptogramin lyase